MFTGIIEEVGRIRAIERQAVSARLTVAASKVLSDVHLGDSIAVNGVCLTVTSFGRDYFCADVMHETLNRSSLGALGVKSPVNLERAMLAGGRFGGHIVSGHIDGTGTIRDVRRDGNAVFHHMAVGHDVPVLRQDHAGAGGGCALTGAGDGYHGVDIPAVNFLKGQRALGGDVRYPRPEGISASRWWECPRPRWRQWIPWEGRWSPRAAPRRWRRKWTARFPAGCSVSGTAARSERPEP